MVLRDTLALPKVDSINYLGNHSRIYELTSPLANALSYSADSNAAERNSRTGIFPFSVNVVSKDFNCIDLKIRKDFINKIG